MAYNEELAHRINRLLTSMERKFEEKKMFGGLTFMVKDKMCCGIVKEDLMLRCLPEKYESLLEHPYAGEMDFTGRIMKGFLMIDGNGLNTEKELKYWVNLALEYVDNSPGKKKKPVKKTSSANKKK